MMGITDDVAVYGPQIAQYRQIGNAVCPPVAHAIATKIMEALGLTARSKRPCELDDDCTQGRRSKKTRRV
jgi:hypothetical protein